MKFTETYQELVNSTEIIRALVANVSQEEAQSKPMPETWSMLEVLCHLYDEERGDFREHLDFILHRQNEEWKRIEPQDWVAARKYNERNFIEMQGMFFEERRKSLDWLIDQQEAGWDTPCKTYFGTISAGDVFASWAAHDNLHIRQLVEIKRHHIESISRPYKIGYAGDW